MKNAEIEADEWHRLLGRLLDDHGALVDDFLVRLAGSGTYGGVNVSSGDLRRAASDTLELLIRRLAGLPISPELLAVPADLGVRRARQGVAREALMDAVRLDFRVLWAGLVRAGGDESSDLIVRHAEQVLSTVEQYIGDVQTAFLDEQAALAQDSRAAVRRALSMLLHAGDQLEDVLHQVSAALRIPVDAELEVVHVPTASAERARRIISAVYLDRQYAEADLDDGTLFVRRTEIASPLEVALASTSGGVVSGVRGLRHLPAAVALARRISPHAPPSRLVRQENVWLAVVRDCVAKDLPLIAGTLDNLRALPADEQSRIIETVLHFAETGSIKVAAETLYCHRNTVVNRLRQFANLTGCDLTIPTQASQALVALGPLVTLSPARDQQE